jgi:hypothetical protein
MACLLQSRIFENDHSHTVLSLPKQANTGVSEHWIVKGAFSARFHEN